MGRLQIEIGSVQRVAVPVIAETYGLRTGVCADRVPSPRALIDVIAEVYDEVERIAGHVPIGRVIAVLVVLARGEGKAQIRKRGTDGRGRACASDRAQLRACLEAIPVPAPGCQSLDLDVHGMGVLRSRQRDATSGDAPKAFVMGHLPRHLDGQRPHPATL